MTDEAEKVEINWEHDWKQFVIIPVTQKPSYVPSGYNEPLTSIPLFCARCPRCNGYYTQELAYTSKSFGGKEGQLHLPQYGCKGPEDN